MTTTKLLAVVALATSTAACTATSRTRIVHEPVGQLVRPTVAVEKPILQAVKVELQASTPRTLKTGAPACGNTQSKATRKDC